MKRLSNSSKHRPDFVESMLIVCLLICSAAIIISSTAIIRCCLPVHGDDLATVVTERYDLNLSELDTLVERKILTAPELTLLESHAPVPRQVVWRILLPAYAIYPYPAESYPSYADQIELTAPEEKPYLDAFVAASLCDLVPPKAEPEGYMTKSEFRALLSELESNHFLLPVPMSDCPYLDTCAWDAETYRGRNALISAWENIPSAWRTDFQTHAWKIQFTCPSLLHTESGTVSRDQADGAISYSRQTIYLDTDNPSTPLHEFAHFAAYRAGWHNFDDSVLTQLFQTEAPRLTTILCPYAQTAPREYFAEFTSAWLTNPSLRPQLAQLAPDTSAHLQQLMSDYSSLVPSPRGAS